MTFRTLAFSSAATLLLTHFATAQESGGSTSGGASSSAPSAPPQQPAPPPAYTPPPPPPPSPPPELLPGGFYLGAGAGWDGQNEITWNDTFGDSGHFDTHDNPILIGSLGYKFPGTQFRLEAEGGYTWHSLSSFHDNSIAFPGTGHANLGHVLFNGLYDIPLAPRLALSLGGGIGAGFSDFQVNSPVTAGISNTGFMWQAIGGLSYGVSPNAELFADYRYRDAEVGGNIPFATGGSVHVGGFNDNVVLAGFRWYLSPQPQ